MNLRIILSLFYGVVVGFTGFIGIIQHTVGFRGDFCGLFLFSAAFQFCTDGFPIQPCKIVLFRFQRCFHIGNSFQFGNVDLHWGLLWDLGLRRLCDTIILVAESRAVQSFDNMAHRIVKVIRGSQHIGHIQSCLCMLACMGQAENAPQNLLHIHLTCLVGKRGKNIGKGAIPALFQRIDRDDVANRAIGRHQIHIFQFIHIGGANGDLFCGDTGVHQLVPQLFKSGRIFLALGLCLEQGDGADIFACFGILRICKFFQLIS